MKHAIKLVACDLDGTIVNEDNTISMLSASALRRLQAQGIRFLPCTGRSYYDMRSAFPKDLSFSSILLNGAMFADEKGFAIRSYSMNKEQVEPMEQQLHAGGFPCLYFTSNGLYGSGDISQLERCVQTFYPNTQDSAYFTEPIHAILDHNEISSDILKMETMHANLHRVQRMKEILSQNEIVQVASSLPYNIEITVKNINKAAMLKQVMTYYGLHEQEILFFGDSANDLEVFAQFPNCVAVNNAILEIKRLTNRHCASCEQDGVAHYLYQHIISS